MVVSLVTWDVLLAVDLPTVCHPAAYVKLQGSHCYLNPVDE